MLPETTVINVALWFTQFIRCNIFLKRMKWEYCDNGD